MAEGDYLGNGNGGDLAHGDQHRERVPEGVQK